VANETVEKPLIRKNLKKSPTTGSKITKMLPKRGVAQPKPGTFQHFSPTFQK
jgi:hypothetical protein